MAQPNDLPQNYRLQQLRSHVASYNEIAVRHLTSPAVTLVNPRTATKGEITKPDGRLSPERIEPWNASDMDCERGMIETILRAVDEAGPDHLLFPSRDNVHRVSQDLGRLDSENALLLFDADTLHKPAMRILRALLASEPVRAILTQYAHERGQHAGPHHDQHAFEYEPGEVTFPTHLNLLRKTLKRKREEYEAEGNALPAPVRGPADVFCIFEPPKDAGNAPRLLFLKEAKASHKLTTDLIDGAVAGGQSLDPRAIMGRGAGDTVHPDSDTCAFWFAAVCAQIYSSMIQKGLRYGVVSTGTRYIFVSIDPEDLSVLRYSPSQVTSAATSPLMRIIALSLLAMQGNGYLPNNAQLEDIRRGRGLIWATGTLSFTTAGGTPAPAHLDSDYEAPTSDGSSSMSEQFGGNQLHDGDTRHTPGRGLSASNGPAPVHSPPWSTPPRPAPDTHKRISFYPSPRSPSRPTTLGERERRAEISLEGDIACRDEGRSESGKRTKVDHGHGDATATSHASPKSSPRSRSLPVQPVSVSQSLYCTQRCLQSLIRPGEQDDRECPNYAEHARNASQESTTAKELRRYLRAQLGVKARDLPSDYDWGYCILTSAVGSAPVLKVRLGISGHVILAKGFAPSDLRKMHREATFYTRLHRLQGIYVPVCLGTMELQGDEVLKHDTWDGELVIAGLLLLGWAGHGLDSWPRMGVSRRGEAGHAFVRDLTVEARKTLTEIHKAGVWHRDIALRNVLVRSFGRQDDGPCPKWQLQVMIIDFELSWTRTKYRQYQRRRLQGSNEEGKTDEELNKEFAGKLVSELDRCAKEMEAWCISQDAQGHAR